MFHKIGNAIELRSSADAIKACRLDWEVYKVPVYHIKPEGNKVPCPNFAGIFRKDTDYNLGIVGDAYSVIQNAEAATIVDSILEQEVDAKIIRGGELFHGDRMFLNLKLSGDILLGSEYFQRIIMISWSHDGGYALSGNFLLQRVATGAILKIDAKEITTSVKIRHSGKTEDKIKVVKNLLKDAYHFFENIESKMEILAVTPMSDGDFKGMLSKLFPDSTTGTTKGQTRTQNKRDDVFGLYYSGTNSINLHGNKLGGLMAITEYCNTTKPTRVEEGKDRNEVELSGILFGSRTSEINEAFKILLDSMTV